MSEFVWPPPPPPPPPPAGDFAEREPVYAVPPKRGHPYQKKRRTPEEILANIQRKQNERAPIEAAKKAAAKAAKNKAADKEQAKLDAAMAEAIAGRGPFPKFQTGLSKRSTGLVGPPERHVTEDNIRTQLNIEKLRAERAAEFAEEGAAGGAAGGQGGGRRKTKRGKRKMRKTRKHKTRGRK